MYKLYPLVRFIFFFFIKKAGKEEETSEKVLLLLPSYVRDELTLSSKYDDSLIASSCGH